MGNKSQDKERPDNERGDVESMKVTIKPAF